jgi:hypothetical protein
MTNITVINDGAWNEETGAEPIEQRPEAMVPAYRTTGLQWANNGHQGGLSTAPG